MRRPSGSKAFPVGMVTGMVAGIVLTALVAGAIALLSDDGDGRSDAPPVSSRPATDGGPATTAPMTTSSGVDGADDAEGSAGADDADGAADADEGAEDDADASGDGAPEEGAGPPVTAVAAPGAVPDGTPVVCPRATIEVRTAEELRDALASAEPGATIHLADGRYVGAFVTSRAGTEAAPVFLCGGPGAVLEGEGPRSGYVLHLRNVSWWRLVGFSVRNGQKGVMADGTTNSVIQQLTVTDIGDEAIHLRSHSSANAVIGNTVRRTGLRREKFGEGIYIGSATSNWKTSSGGGPDRSDHNLVQGNTISETSSESIDVKEGTTGGRLIGNTLDGAGMTGADSLIDVKGNDWLVQGNVGRNAPEEGFQTHRILEGWGTRNTFEGNSIGVDGDGDHIWVHDPRDTDNRVACDNRSESGSPVRSNIPCQP